MRCLSVNQYRVRLNTCTETAIARDDSEIGRFGLRFSSKKDMDIEIGFLAEKSDFAVFIECRRSEPF